MITAWRQLRSGTLARLGLGRAMPGGDSARRSVGLRGERIAARFLKRAGYRIVQRNVRVAIGEVDLVCLAPDRATVVLVEVKTRTPSRDGSAPLYAPEASVTSDKRRKLAAIARWLAKANSWQGRPIRIDTVAVEWSSEASKPIVRHHAGAATTYA